MASADVLNLIEAPDFVHQLEVQCAKVATTILTETENELSSNRLDWARKVLARPATGAEMVVWAVVSSPGVGENAGDLAKITDEAVETAITTVLNGFLRPINPEVSKQLPVMKVLG